MNSLVYINFMSLDIWECLKWNAFACTLNNGQMLVDKDNCRKADLYVYTEESNRDPEVGIQFHDCVTIFTQS